MLPSPAQHHGGGVMLIVPMFRSSSSGRWQSQCRRPNALPSPGGLPVLRWGVALFYRPKQTRAILPSSRPPCLWEVALGPRDMQRPGKSCFIFWEGREAGMGAQRPSVEGRVREGRATRPAWQPRKGGALAQVRQTELRYQRLET